MSELYVDRVMLCPIDDYFRIMVNGMYFDVPYDKEMIVYLIGRLAMAYLNTRDTLVPCPANEA